MKLKSVFYYIVAATMLLVSGCNESTNVPKPNPNPDPNPTKQTSSWTVEFTASPNTFSVEGGSGKISGTLKEISAQGKLLQEKALKNEDFTLSFKGVRAQDIQIDNTAKTFVVPSGEQAIFDIEATVTAGVQKGTKQTISIVRGGKISVQFKASASEFSVLGGKGTIEAVKTITDQEGKTLKEEKLPADAFNLVVKQGAPEDITVNNQDKSFAVEMGLSNVFVLEAATGDGQSQAITISREGDLAFAFKAEPNDLPAAGGSGKVSAQFTATDKGGKVIKEAALDNKYFTISAPNASHELTINDAEKTFKIAAGAEATFTINAVANFTGASAQRLTITRNKKKLPKVTIPLEYVAEYNVNQEGIGFANDQANGSSGYFTWDDAVSKFSAISIDGADYHLPSREEWESIAPRWVGKRPFCELSNPQNIKDVEETVVINGETITSTSDFFGYGEDVCYAVRYKGTKYISAWTYYYGDNKYGDGKILIILARSLAGNEAITVEELANPSFWEADQDRDVLRVFPACGNNINGTGDRGQIDFQGDYGWYWSKTSDEKGFYYMGFNMNFVYTSNDAHFKHYGRSVRLFKNTPVESKRAQRVARRR